MENSPRVLIKNENKYSEPEEKRHNQALHLTPEAGAFFAFAISEKNVAFAKTSLASGAGELYVLRYEYERTLQ